MQMNNFNIHKIMKHISRYCKKITLEREPVYDLKARMIFVKREKAQKCNTKSIGPKQRKLKIVIVSSWVLA